ncbi:MAG: hypothetical protein GW878_01930 [Acidobacteria bacterium]|nr:hypothetical protein [Acidobacteriota bacterium]
MAATLPRVFRPVSDGARARVWLVASLAVVTVLLLASAASLLWPHHLEYVIRDETLHIIVKKESLDNTAIRLPRINAVSQETLRNGTMRFGTGKPGYCVGFWEYPRLGEVWQATTCGPRGVLIRATGQATPVLLTPADPDGFIAALQQMQDGVFPPERRHDGALATAIVHVTLLFVLGGALILAFSVAPRRLGYSVAAGRVLIQTLFRRREIALAGARVRPHRPLEGARTSGVPLPGHVVGTYLLDHQATWVYASKIGAGALIEADGRFFINPEDVDGFLAACEAEGATRAAQALR